MQKTKKEKKSLSTALLGGEMLEIQVHVANKSIRTFLQNGFFMNTVTHSNFHNHRYCEIHAVIEGRVEFLVEGERMVVEKGQGIIIPVGVYHSRRAVDGENARASAFQVEMSVDVPTVAILEGSEKLLSSEICKYQRGEDCVRLPLAVGVICSYFCGGENFRLSPVFDREYIIYEFFSNNYDKDVTLSDLAALLNVSPKQAERLVVKSTGMSFRQQMAAKRIENARMLIKAEGVSLARAAELVGYQSYSGFWKAMRGYENTTK